MPEEEVKVETITEAERKLITYCEMQWMINSKLPSPDNLCERFGISPKKLQGMLSRGPVKASFEARGIPIGTVGHGLTAEQVLAINTVLNLADTRSERKKLSDLGIPAMKWAGWKKDPAFMAYYSELSNKAFLEAIPDSKMALVDNVRRGDLGSIKLFYEMTGVHDPNRGAVDPRELMNRVFEIITLHVRDPQVLLSISQGMVKLAQQLDGSTAPVATIVDQRPELEEPIYVDPKKEPWEL